MATDLYRDDFSILSDQDVYQAIEAFTRITESVDAKPREGFVLDFKKDWNDGALQTVAAFAHTFGGLLFIGISDNDGRPDELCGVECHGELKTRIANSIANNISPPPFFQVAECALPGKPNTKLAVVRVGQGNQIHFFTKKGERHPIYVRNEDSSDPADAAQLRSLIERKTHPLQAQQEIESRMKALTAAVTLAKTTLTGTSTTYLTFHLVPVSFPTMTLDSSLEQQFRKLLTNLTRLIFGESQGCERDHKRDASFYEWRWFRPSDKYESVWRLTSNGDIGFATQVRVDSDSSKAWSLGNTLAELWFMLEISRAFWSRTAGYLGEAQVTATLRVWNLSLTPAETMDLWPQDDPTGFITSENFGKQLADSIISEPPPQSATLVSATGVFNSALERDASSQLITSLLNQLLRGLGYSADLKGLRSATNILLGIGSGTP